MAPFSGFPKGKVRLTPIPAPFFTRVLPEIDHLGELKVTLYTFWRLDRLEGPFRYLRHSDYLADPDFMEGLIEGQEPGETALDGALARAVERGVLLKVDVETGQGPERFYFLNSARGRAAIAAIQAGEWQPGEDPSPPELLRPEPPNIFRLYEENLGPLTPMIAEALLDAEATYPLAWIEEAVRIAVENNVRRWRYIDAILRSWQEEGRDERRAEGDSEEDRHRYIRGRFSEFIEH